MDNLKKITIADIIINVAYLTFLYVTYGLMSSISRYVKELLRDDLEVLTMIWLMSILMNTTYVSLKQAKWWSTFLFLSGFTLFPIVFFSGYYEGFEVHATENVIHVVLVYISIPLAFIYMVIDSVMNKIKLKSIIPISAFFIFTGLTMCFDMPKHTTFIEIFALIVIFYYLLAKKDESI